MQAPATVSCPVATRGPESDVSVVVWLNQADPLIPCVPLRFTAPAAGSQRTHGGKDEAASLTRILFWFNGANVDEAIPVPRCRRLPHALSYRRQLQLDYYAEQPRL